MRDLFIGVMSGTSLDGIDVVLVEFDKKRVQVHRAATTPYPNGLRKKILGILQQGQISLQELGELDVAVGHFFSECISSLIASSSFNANEFIAIGHSGHTVFHKPASPNAFTMQIGDPSTIAAETGITTIGNIRNMDLALGGQGAPLAPAFHHWYFATPDESRVVVNIGGIANVSILHPKQPLIGFDTGPGNTLLDNWSLLCRGKPFDDNGSWAKTGQINQSLLALLKTDKYFTAVPPKSTGLEYFNPTWLKNTLQKVQAHLADEDIQATLTELTASTIADAIDASGTDPKCVILCGGGAFNTTLTERISALLPDAHIKTTSTYGIEPQWIEAVLFAWLARNRLHKKPGNIPTVTGASHAAPLGGIYYGSA